MQLEVPRVGRHALKRDRPGGAVRRPQGNYLPAVAARERREHRPGRLVRVRKRREGGAASPVAAASSGASSAGARMSDV